jgi:APA family basic amino acid/polyamine antiporter
MQPGDLGSKVPLPEDGVFGLEPKSELTGLVRRLGLFDMTMLVMGSVIGVGIFMTPHAVAQLAPNPYLVLGAWILGGIVTLAGSMVYAEWTRRRPDVGGQYAYLREAYHPAVGFLYGWSLLWIIQSGGIASVAVVFAEYFHEILQLWGIPLEQTGGLNPSTVAKLGSVTKVFFATTAIGIFTIINCLGVRTAGTTQNIFMVLKILAIAMLVVCGALVATSDSSAVSQTEAAINPTAISTELPSPSSPWWPLTALAAAMVPVFFSYGGWHTTTFVGEEVRDPRRTLARALVLGVSGVMVLYVAVSFVCVRVLGVDGLAQAEKPASAVMQLALGKSGAAIISIGIAISALGFLSQGTLTSPRVYYAMARDGLFFRSVAWVHPRTRVPIVAIILQGAVAMVIAASGDFLAIVNYVMSVELTFWSLTALGLFVIRRKDAGDRQSASLRIPGHPATTLLFVAVNVAVLANTFFERPRESALVMGIALAGAPVYFYWRRGRNAEPIMS